ncbi:MAG: helix-turn-helix domain-containing protein [Acutalibacteraceae bacterium]
MDCAKTGALIRRLRQEKKLTQKNIADALGICDKTVSKWECGLGFPDTSLWADLSVILGADINGLLEGELEQNKPDNGNIDRIKFYVCETCNNIIFSTSSTGAYCCGRKLNELQITQKEININAKIIDNEYFITIDHSMSKDNYILFTALVKDDTVVLKRLYPEQNPEIILPLYRKAKLFICDSNYNLFKIQL